MKSIHRRMVLRGFGGTAIALPFLDIMARPAPARAQNGLSKTGPNGAPKRFVVLFTPCGQGPDWLKNTNGADGKLVLAPSLSPLERHKADLLFVNGVDMTTARKDPNLKGAGKPGAGPHSKDTGHLLTATATKGALAGGISVDQAIAKEIRGETKFPSLQLSVHQGVTNAFFGQIAQHLAYSAPGVPLPNISDPQRVFTKLFTDLQTDPAAFQKLQARRKSILDGATRDYAAFAQRIGGDDRRKVDVHLNAIREVEQQISINGTKALSCSKPTITAKQDCTAAGYVTTGQAMMDMLGIALACDLTRVATLMFEGGGGNMRLPGFTRGIHDVSHDLVLYPKDSNTPSGDRDRNAYTKWYANYFAGFIDKLKALAEPAGGSVMDNTAIFWCSEHSCGNHNWDRMPFAVMGSGGGYFKTGRQLLVPNKGTGLNFCQEDYCTVPPSGPGHGDLLVGLMRAMGIPATTFGDPTYCKGELAGLTG